MTSFVVLLATILGSLPIPVVGSDGALVDLRRELTGQAGVVIVMKSEGCSVCRAQLSALSKRRLELKNIGARVLGLNVDSPVKNTLLEAMVGLKVYSDRRGELLRTLGLWIPRLGAPMPGLIFFDRCGDVTSVFSGRQPGQDRTLFIIEMLRKNAEKQVCGTVI